MALEEQSPNTRNIQPGTSTEKPFEGKIVLEKTDFEKARDLLNELAIHELAPKVGQKPNATGTPAKGFGGKGRALKVKKEPSDDEGGDNEEPEDNGGKKGSGKKGKGKKEESEDGGEDGDDGNRTDPDDEPDEGGSPHNSNRLPPRVPTATEQPAVGHPDYPLDPVTHPIARASMDRAVLMFPCSQSRAMKPWYMFRVYGDGTVHDTCDGHTEAAKQANPYYPWPYLKYHTRDRTHATREMKG
jgi:hypothetical protein